MAGSFLENAVDILNQKNKLITEIYFELQRYFDEEVWGELHYINRDWELL